VVQHGALHHPQLRAEALREREQGAGDPVDLRRPVERGPLAEK
jgi:hypothetical protein